MKFSDLQQLCGEQPVFHSGALLAGQASPAHVRRQLSRWIDSGKVLALRRGVYALAEPYAKSKPYPFVLANELRRASYVSLQSALAWYGCIPEFVPVTTSVTTERPEEVVNPLGRFQFRHIRQDMFRGMRRTEVSGGQSALVASPEKALIDLLYLTPHSDQPDYLKELRLEPQNRLEWDRLRELAESTGSAKVMRAVVHLEPILEDSEWGAPL